ncbi:hypothetical protein [Actinophytocola sp. NPDC049390]|uniref:hypothetical protein n=1 Tax=Actinophytocola sp. NPDC049390 TaxID=3363894 RepID=UPI00378C6BD0
MTDVAAAQTRAGYARQWLYDRRLAFGVELLALLPLVAMAFEVAGAPRTQPPRFWAVLGPVTGPDGGYDPGGVLDLAGGHPLFVPSFLYWADAKWFDGDNRVLGWLAVGLAAFIVLRLRAALPRVLPDVLRAGLVVAISALVFGLHGVSTFVVGMTGVAWFTVHLLVVLSVLLARKRRWWSAWLAGVLACASHGAGFAVWPALFLMTVMHGERWWRRIATFLLGAATAAVWVVLAPPRPTGDVGSLLYTFLTLIGHVWTGTTTDLAAIAGGGVLCGFGALITVPAARTRRLWVWWSLALYAVTACGMVAVVRGGAGFGVGLSGQYASLSVIASTALLVVVATVAFRRSPRNAARFALAAVAIGLVGFTLGAPASASNICPGWTC